ncbi:MAG: PEGA domain-containing protein, partial [Methanobacteriota archaeon]
AKYSLLMGTEYANLVAIEPTITVEPTQIGGDFGFFKIDSAPTGADVFFDTNYQGTSPVLVKVMSTASPSHDFMVRMNGYSDYTQHLSYNPGKDQTVPLYAPLTPLAQYWSISVTSSPSGALATLDSGQQYLTPCTFTLVLPGTHMITVSKSGYNTYTQQVVLNYGSQSVYAPLTVLQSTGTLFVDSYPQGADVRVDNLWQGQTPQRIGNLASGSHTVKLLLSGYQTITQQVMITTGQETQITPIMTVNTPQVTTGSVSVASNPSGASVFLNADYQGLTPSSGYLDLPDLTPGVYTIQLKEPQSEDYSASITVIAGQTTPVNAELKAPPIPSAINGTLSVSSSPAGAQVFLENQLVGITPVSISTVVPGQYGLLLKMNGYNDYANRVQIDAGRSTTASINLTPQATVVPTSTGQSTPTSLPTQSRSPFSAILVPAGLLVALLLIRRDR